MPVLKLMASLTVVALLAIGAPADDKKADEKKADKKAKAEDKKPDDKKAESKRGYIGVQIGHNEDQKIIIQDVVGGSPAEKAGLKADDVIVKLDGKEFDNLEDFVIAVRAQKPGAKITLTVKRGDKDMEIKITAGEAPPRPEDK